MILLNNKWDLYFLRFSLVAATNSVCYAIQRGIIIVKDKQILSTGYNGPPSGTRHPDELHPEYPRQCIRKALGYKSGEGLELCRCSHAEINGISNAAKIGISLKDTTMYCIFIEMPCQSICAGAIINTGIKEIVLAGDPKEYNANGYSREMLEEAKIKVRRYSLLDDIIKKETDKILVPFWKII